jgi:hypothetical protein
VQSLLLDCCQAAKRFYLKNEPGGQSRDQGPRLFRYNSCMPRPVDLKEYVADEPLLIAGSELVGFTDAAEWDSPDAWVASLESMKPAPQAAIIPIELSASGWNRQDLYGLELLSHLRWSTSDPLRGIPVLAVAWQPLLNILQRRPEFLLVKPGIDFCQLPEALDRLTAFRDAVVKGSVRGTSVEEIIAVTSLSAGLASRVSHHDLANDYYAAYRLWMGYKALLRVASNQPSRGSTSELERVSSVEFEWESKVFTKLRSPLVRQFQASRSGTQIPRYPTVSSTTEVVGHHLAVGLPRDTRILFVDDEFDKGMADVLLQILFGVKSFTRQMKDEWVYSETSEKDPELRWARFVCVRSADLALNWLAHWDEIPGTCVESKADWNKWLENWNHELTGQPIKASANLSSQEILGENRSMVLDCLRAGPRSRYSAMLLDLRLKPVTETLYSIRDFPSVQLRSTVKTHRPELPVIIFTASRQTMNSAELLDSTREIDGWLVKEGPDIPVDREDANSASAVAYLLERIHLYSTLALWYRESFGWDTKRKLSCAQLYNSTHSRKLLDEVSQTSQNLFDGIRQGSISCQPGDTFLAFIQSKVSPHPFPVSQTLVARRVAVGVLLLCANIQSGRLEWDADAAEAFDGLLPGRATKKLVIAVYDKLNFNQVLWMRSSNILSQLLEEEFEWLKRQNWPPEKQDVLLASLSRERRLLGF